MTIKFGEDTKAKLGDIIQLQNQNCEVVKCIRTSVLMLNIDEAQLQKGDLPFIKKLGLTISSPHTLDAIALGAHTLDSRVEKFKDWWDKDEDKDDSDLFSDAAGLFVGYALGSLAQDFDSSDDSSSDFGSSDDSSSSFDDFGGGSFSGGGASGDW